MDFSLVKCSHLKNRCVNINDQGMEEMNSNIRNRLNNLENCTIDLSR